MKLFFVAQFLPYPLTEGTSINIFNRLDRLRLRHDVILFAPLRRPGDEDSLRFLKQRGWNIETLSKPRVSQMAKILSRVRASFSRVPVHYVLSWDDAIGRELEKQIRAHEPDVVIVEHLVLTRFLPYIRRATGVKLVFWDHNVESLWQAESDRQFGLTFTGILRRSQMEKVQRLELEMLNTFDMTVAVTDSDRQTLQKMAPAAMVRFVPIGVDAAHFTPHPEAEEDDLIVFVGGLNIGSNLDALKLLVNEILPLVRKRRPGARVEIVGRAPNPSVLALRSPPEVSVIPDVPDVRPYMARASVFVVPIRPRSGVRLKILEGLAMEKAVVSTSSAAEGLDVVDGEHLLVRDDAKGFADAIVELLADRAKRRMLGSAGKSLVDARYSWDAACSKLDDHLFELLSSGKSFEQTALNAR